MRGGLEGETSETAVSQNPEISEAATTKTSQATKPGTAATGEGAGCTPNCSRPRGGKPPPQCSRGIPPAARSPHPVLGSCYPPPWYPLPNHSLYSHHPVLLPVLLSSSQSSRAPLPVLLPGRSLLPLPTWELGYRLSVVAANTR